MFVLVPDVQLSNTKRPGRDASFTNGAIYLQMFWACVPLAVGRPRGMSGRSLCSDRRTQQLLNQYCARAPSQVLLCHWDCLILRIDDAVAGLGVDVGVKGGAQPHGEPAFRLG